MRDAIEWSGVPGALHRLVDRAAMAVEDLHAREPVPYRPGPDAPLDPFGPLGPSAHEARPGGVLPPIVVTAAAGPRRGTAVLVPPWKIRSAANVAPWVHALAAAGLDVWMPVPPLHLERTPPGQRGGEGVVSPDLGSMRGALELSVREARACVAAAAEHGEVALVGLSLGALVAAWVAAGPERVSRAALVAPPADLAAVFRETPIGRRYAAIADRAGARVPPGPELDERLSRLAPLSLRPSAGRVLVVGGRHDAIAVGGATALARAWGLAPSLHARGHITLLFACAAARREVAAFAADLA